MDFFVQPPEQRFQAAESAPAQPRPLSFSSDPAPRATRPRAWSRTLDCERMDAELSSRRYPGSVAPPPSRGPYAERATVVCRERLLRPGLRESSDEALLRTLDSQTVNVAKMAVALRPDLAESTWLVEVFVANPVVAFKVGFATKDALLNSGTSVSDRTPILGRQDIDVLMRMPPESAYPAACERYFATGSLTADDVLLAVLTMDTRETILHAGLCVNGTWSWLR